MTSSTQFHCRISVFDQRLLDLDVFVWELKPLDNQTRSAREWIEEYTRANCDELFPLLGIKGNGGWEAVFVANMRSLVSSGMYGEHDEDIELIKWQVQPIPSEEFE